jgi:curved DNA-binding protein CbpA
MRCSASAARLADEIKKSFRKLAKKYHPDSNKG